MSFVRAAADVKEEQVAAGTHTYRSVLIGETEGPHFQLRRFRIDPGGGMPLHTNRVEHEQYVIGGRARVRIGDQTFEVGADDVVLIPAGVPHSYAAIGTEPFVFLCAVPNGPDRIELVED